MDQITYEVRLARWKEAIKQYQSRPEGQSMTMNTRSGFFVPMRETMKAGE